MEQTFVITMRTVYVQTINILKHHKHSAIYELTRLQFLNILIIIIIIHPYLALR